MPSIARTQTVSTITVKYKKNINKNILNIAGYRGYRWRHVFVAGESRLSEFLEKYYRKRCHVGSSK